MEKREVEEKLKTTCGTEQAKHLQGELQGRREVHVHRGRKAGEGLTAAEEVIERT